MTDLVVAPCSYKAAKFAVENWHYSQVMPAGKTVKFGVWEGGQFIGSVLFSWGANNRIGSPYGLKMTEVCELVRVALTSHKSQVSQIVSSAMKKLREQSPGLRLIVSYADPERGHNGSIYQAMNWIYTGSSKPQRETLGLAGGIVHKRSAFSKYGTVSGQKYSKILWKHKYLFPLDRAMRRQIESLAQPYPKRADVGEIESRDGTTVQT